MNLAEYDHGQQSNRPSAEVSVVVEGAAAIGDTRDAAREFLESLEAAHGISVSSRAVETVQLVVSELVTNAHKYAPGPCLLTLEADEGMVAVTVWDSSTTLPLILPPDPARVGQHGLELVMALCRSFEAHREPVGKRLRATVVLNEEKAGGAGGRQPS
ncbi:ATP-binding protein [Streptomyces sp. NPDC088747]|uniref:ATP-binding protein n=1 Tax=Streptomyces sp. NPDC088747 TaxID=3365886 RepID=UPI003803F9A0